MKYVEVVFNLPLEGSFTYILPDKLECSPGMRVEADFRNRKKSGIVIDIHTETPEKDFKIKEINRIIDQEPLLTEELLNLGRWISKIYLCSLGEVLSAIVPGGKREKALPDFPTEIQVTPDPLNLTSEQGNALLEIESKPEGEYYLHGITGSGKTEVYLRAAETTLAEGRGVIYLVPEIALTHQLIDGIQERFGDSLAVLHSGLTNSERLAHWLKIIRGHATIVVGARSAVFAPFKDLGLIIVDEEHESSYKSGATPRYHARQVAMKRCRDAHARLIMGSATPSLEAYYLMKEKRIHGFKLLTRPAGGGNPEITVIDMKKESSVLSQYLLDAIDETVKEKRQVILFLNRRGFSYFFHCRTCGYEMLCRQCSVAMTYHKAKNRMICHYCGYSQKPIESCPECGSLDIGYGGFGTEQIEEELSNQFPNLSIARLDTDSVRKKENASHIIKDFQNHKIDILLGTQMVAKGLNFPKVKLVGIVLLDTSLNLPDFRAEERAFALATQVSGRAGRFFPDGQVIIQTYKPESNAVQKVIAHDQTQFYNDELQTRKILGFPPYRRLIRIVFRSKDAESGGTAARVFTEMITRDLTAGDEILGPAECPIAMIAVSYRVHILIKSENITKCHHVVQHYLKEIPSHRSVYREVDLDPISVL